VSGGGSDGATPEPLPPGLVDAPARPAASPHAPAARRAVGHVRTHISRVFLTPGRAYKLRKAVDLGFLRFATRAERDHDCVREVRLNRRLSPDVYLGVAPVRRRARGWAVGETVADGLPGEGDGEDCVVMRRLPEGRDARSLLERGQLGASHLQRLATLLAGFHACHGLGAPPPIGEEEWIGRIRRPVLENFDALDTASGVPTATVERVRDAAAGFLEAHAERFEARRRAGRLVDGHGDLHLEHVVFERDDAAPLLIDCIEFSDALRQVDTASEVAFLAMDLRYRGERGLGERFVASYAAERDDHDLYRVLDFFVSYRAAVRAKVAALAAGEEEIDAGQRRQARESAERHLALAGEALGPGPGAALWIVCGPVGTGKSTLARALSERLGAVSLSSDRVRKALAGMSPTDRPDPAQRERLYGDAGKERVYQALLARAEPVLASGRPVVLDATFSLRRHRDAARALAGRHGAPALALRAELAPELARARLAHRAAAGADASDAGPERVDDSRARFEPLTEWPEHARLELDTGDDAWPERLAAALARLAPGRG